jgi:HD-GYP domain-containing protein (c-di-GMP phosphodiesterase class II)
MDEKRLAELQEENRRLKEQVAALKSRLADGDKMVADGEAKLRIAYEAAVQSLVRAVESKDPYTKGHYDLVSRYAVETGKRLGLSEEALNQLRISALLMDIGKVAIDNSLLAKTAPLTQQEEEIIRSHVRIGAEILDPIVYPWDISAIVYQHQERFDGSGYPEHIKGDQILVEAKILGICESFVAMMAKRAFREAYSRDFTMGILREESGRKFDPRVVKAFTEVLENRENLFPQDFEELKEGD